MQPFYEGVSRQKVIKWEYSLPIFISITEIQGCRRVFLNERAGDEWKAYIGRGSGVWGGSSFKILKARL